MPCAIRWSVLKDSFQLLLGPFLSLQKRIGRLSFCDPLCHTSSELRIVPILSIRPKADGMESMKDGLGGHARRALLGRTELGLERRKGQCAIECNRTTVTG